MIKITFEVDEDFIRENSDLENLIDKIKRQGGPEAMLSLAEALAFKELTRKIDAGKTEFVVTQESLDKKLKALYDHDIADICMMAAMCNGAAEPRETEGN